MPRSFLLFDGWTSSTRVSAWIVSPWNVGNLCCSVSTSRLAMAAPLTSGTLMPSTSEYTRLPTTTLRPCTDCSANQALVCNGWWFIVIMQNRWSSYSVIVLPGQCRYTSPTTKSSRCRPNGLSWVVMAAQGSGAPGQTSVSSMVGGSSSGLVGSCG